MGIKKFAGEMHGPIGKALTGFDRLSKAISIATTLSGPIVDVPRTMQPDSPMTQQIEKTVGRDKPQEFDVSTAPDKDPKEQAS